MNPPSYTRLLLGLTLGGLACTGPDLESQRWTCSAAADCPTGQRCFPGDCPTGQDCATLWCPDPNDCVPGYCRPAELRIPAGPFFMGCDATCNADEQALYPGSIVEVPEFFIDTVEVTVAQFTAAGFTYPYLGWLEGEVLETFPAVGLPLTEARSYCSRLGRRLCTEPEWEKAARGTDRRHFPWGNELPQQTQANCAPGSEQPAGDLTCRDPFENRTAIGSFPRGESPYGVLDLAGNVAEWTEPGEQGAQEVAVRGGSWGCEQDVAQTFYRDLRGPDSREEWLGFRCCR